MTHAIARAAGRPILFSAPMVRALLDGRKTQTRRTIKPRRHASLFDGTWADDYVLDPGNQSWRDEEVRYRVGDRLWVREAWKAHSTFEGVKPRDLPPSHVFYLADPGYSPSGSRGRPGRFMPRWASRLTLIVTDVRVQRVQDISREDAIAEGLIHQSGVIEPDWWVLPEPFHQGSWLSPIAAFRYLWNSLNASRGYGWESNPWVTAISFETHRCNIDSMPEAA